MHCVCKAFESSRSPTRQVGAVSFSRRVAEAAAPCGGPRRVRGPAAARSIDRFPPKPINWACGSRGIGGPRRIATQPNTQKKRREGAAFKNNLKWKNLNRRASSRLRSAARIRSGRQSRMASVVKPAFKTQILHPGRATHLALRDVDFVGPGVPIARSTPQAGRRAVQLVTIPGGAHFCRGALRRNARDVHQRY